MTSGYIHGLVNCKNKLGPYYDSKNHLKVDDQWSQYIYASVLDGKYNPFHLVDLYTFILGAKKKSSSPIALTAPSKERSGISVHINASVPEKEWALESWASFFSWAIKSDLGPIEVFGSPADKPRIDEFTREYKLQDKIQNLCGAATINEIKEKISNSKLFVGIDSFLGHVASLTETPQVMLSIGPSKAEETSPYKDGVIILQSDYKISPDDLISASRQVMTLEESDPSFTCKATKFFGPHPYFSEQISISPQIDTSGVIKEIYKMVWTYFFEEIQVKGPEFRLTSEMARDLSHIASHNQRLFELYKFGQTYAQYILEETYKEHTDMDKIQQYSQNITDIEGLELTIAKLCPELSPIINYAKMARGSIAGNDIQTIAEEYYLLHQSLQLIASTMDELVSSVLKKNQPQQVRP